MMQLEALAVLATSQPELYELIKLLASEGAVDVAWAAKELEGNIRRSYAVERNSDQLIAAGFLTHVVGLLDSSTELTSAPGALVAIPRESGEVRLRKATTRQKCSQHRYADS